MRHGLHEFIALIRRDWLVWVDAQAGGHELRIGTRRIVIDVRRCPTVEDAGNRVEAVLVLVAVQKLAHRGKACFWRREDRQSPIGANGTVGRCERPVVHGPRIERPN